MFELLMFDLDGTLVDSRRDIAFSVNLALAELGMPVRADEEVFGNIGGGVHNLILKSLPEGRADLLDEGVEVFWARYREHVLDSTALYPGIPEMLKRFSGRRMAIVTNKPRDHTRLILQGLGIEGLFASVQGWRPGLNVKPDPELVLRAVGEAGARADSSVLVGDSVADVLSARAAGARSCAVGYGYGSRDRLMEASPDYFAETAGDIERLIG